MQKRSGCPISRDRPPTTAFWTSERTIPTSSPRAIPISSRKRNQNQAYRDWSALSGSEICRRSLHFALLEETIPKLVVSS